MATVETLEAAGSPGLAIDVSGRANEDRADSVGLGAGLGNGVDARAARVEIVDAESSTLLAPEPEEPPAPRIVGRVLTAPLSGGVARPVAGASVRYAPASPEYFEVNERATETFTESDGRFELPVEVWGRLPLTVKAPGHLVLVRELDYVRGELDLGDLLLREAYIVSGRVEGAGGNGVPGVRIFAVDPCSEALHGWDAGERDKLLGESALDGSFSVPAAAKLAPADVFALRFQHHRFRSRIVQGSLAATKKSSTGLVVSLEAGASIRGRVKGYPGVGRHAVGLVSRALFQHVREDWDYDESQRRVAVESDGRFAVHGLKDGESVALAVWTGGEEGSSNPQRRSPWVVATASLGGGASAEYTLDYIEPARVTARLVDAAGTVVEYAHVSCDHPVKIRSANSGAMPGAELPLDTTVAIPGGRVEWICAPVADPVLDVWLQAGSPGQEGDGPELFWEKTLPFLEPGSVVDLGDVVMVAGARSGARGEDPARDVVVLAVDDAGLPIAHRRVSYRSATDTRDRIETTGADGSLRLRLPVDEGQRFRLFPNYRGTDHLQEYRDGSRYVGPLGSWKSVPAGADEVTVLLVEEPLASLQLRVFYGETPLAEASVVFRWFPTAGQRQASNPPRGSSRKGERTDGAGAMEGARFLTGAWRAWVYHPQLRMSEPFDFELQQGANTLELKRSPSTIVGRVEVEGKARPGSVLVRAELSASTAARALNELDPERNVPHLGSSFTETALRDVRFVRSSADGTFRLEGVTPALELKVLALAPGHLMASSDPVVVLAGEVADVGTIRLHPAGAVSVELPLGHDGHLWLTRLPDEELTADEVESLDPVLKWRSSSVRDHQLVDHVPAGSWSAKLIHRPAGAGPEMQSEVETVLQVTPSEAAQLAVESH